MRRILMFGVVFSMMGLLWSAPTASALQSVKLCGSATGLADSLIISGLFDDSGGPFVMHTAWIQFVPTIYKLQGGGAVSEDVMGIDGGLTITNSSDAFGNNPTCSVAPVFQIESKSPLRVSGSAQLRCIGGPGMPFMVNINFNLISCNNRGPFEPAAERAVSIFEEAEQRMHLPAAGYLPNEYRP
jgi:hypothetical protein